MQNTVFSSLNCFSVPNINKQYTKHEFLRSLQSVILYTNRERQRTCTGATSANINPEINGAARRRGRHRESGDDWSIGSRNWREDLMNVTVWVLRGQKRRRISRVKFSWAFHFCIDFVYIFVFHLYKIGWAFQFTAVKICICNDLVQLGSKIYRMELWEHVFIYFEEKANRKMLLAYCVLSCFNLLINYYLSCSSKFSHVLEFYLLY